MTLLSLPTAPLYRVLRRNGYVWSEQREDDGTNVIRIPPPERPGTAMPAALSFDQAPPISVPFRFFLTAPLFGIAAGLALLFGDGNALASRWEPLALA